MDHVSTNGRQHFRSVLLVICIANFLNKLIYWSWKATKICYKEWTKSNSKTAYPIIGLLEHLLFDITGWQSRLVTFQYNLLPRKLNIFMLTVMAKKKNRERSDGLHSQFRDQTISKSRTCPVASRRRSISRWILRILGRRWIHSVPFPILETWKNISWWKNLKI